MIRNTIKTLIAITVSLTLATSCLKKDADPIYPGPGGGVLERVELSSNYLRGDWEIFYNNKLVKNDRNSTSSSDSLGTDYRYTELEGYSVNFTDNGDNTGKFKEYNVFDKVVKEGDYYLKLKKNDSKAQYDSIVYDFIDPETNVRTINSFAFPGVFEPYFSRYNQYRVYLEKEDKVMYYVADTYYYRKKGSGYQLKDKPKNLIDINQLYGEWEFVDFQLQTYGKWGLPDNVKDQFGNILKFESNQYTEYASDGEIVSQGEFKVIDDVIQFKRELVGIGKARSSKLWLEKPIQDGILTNYDKYRDGENSKNVIILEGKYKKVR